MSVTYEPAERRSRWRIAIAGLGVAALALVSIPAFADDSIFFDGDFATTPGAPNISYGGDTGKDCATRGTPVNGAFTVKYNGGQAGDPDHHFTPGELISVAFTAPDGVTLTLTDPTPTVPANWDSQDDEFNILFTTTVSTTSAGGKVEGSLTGQTSGYDAGVGAGNGKPNFQVQINCTPTGSTNHAPVVAFTNPPTTANEGDTKTFNYTIADTDAGDTQTPVSGYPNCGISEVGGHANVLVSSSNTNTGGTFSCRFVDGLQTPIANTVSVEVNDGTANSNVANTDVIVSNLAPVVTVPAFSVTTVNCQVQVSLGNVSFTDAGDYDATWNGDIDWGDGSTHSTFAASAQGLQTSPTHTYTTGGTFAATVTVTDKDHVPGSNTTAAGSSVTVIQYKTDFLPPFDDSSPSGLIVNQMKSGRVVPVKASIYDYCAQAYVTSPAAVTIDVRKVATPTTAPNPDPVESYADAGASSSGTNYFRWTTDSTAPGGGFWIYNLDSKALALAIGQYYRIDIYVGGTRTTGGVLATGTDWAILQPVK